ncbi:MAG: hypothetical protein KDC71_11790, partial [Acidobacteria bacterium]|nr:hypothetical protein [Acidobacteriota bacterium]
SEPFEQAGKANLPANAHWDGMTWIPTSTKIEVNYDSTGAEPYTPILMTGHYFYDSLGVRSAPSPNGIVLGTVPGIALPSTLKIAIWVP